ADSAERRAGRPHEEGDHVHRPAGHRAVEDLPEPIVALGRRHPVVGGAGVLLVARADEGEVLGPGDVVRGAPVKVTARQLPLVEGEELSGPDPGLAEALLFDLGAVAPDHVVGPAEPRDVVYPASDGLAPAHGVYRSRYRGPRGPVNLCAREPGVGWAPW